RPSSFSLSFQNSNKYATTAITPLFCSVNCSICSFNLTNKETYGILPLPTSVDTLYSVIITQFNNGHLKKARLAVSVGVGTAEICKSGFCIVQKWRSGTGCSPKPLLAADIRR